MRTAQGNGYSRPASRSCQACSLRSMRPPDMREWPPRRTGMGASSAARVKSRRKGAALSRGGAGAAFCLHAALLGEEADAAGGLAFQVGPGVGTDAAGDEELAACVEEDRQDNPGPAQ